MLLIRAPQGVPEIDICNFVELASRASPERVLIIN